MGDLLERVLAMKSKGLVFACEAWVPWSFLKNYIRMISGQR